MSLPDWLLYGAAALFSSYLVDAVPFGLLVGYAAAGVDIRTLGSHNIGATNAARVVGRGRKGVGMAIFVAVFLLDGLKGAGPVLLWRWLGPASGPELAVLAAAAAAVLGHMFSVFLRFSGGKGVAVGCGVAVALFPLPTLAAAGVFLAVLAFTRTVSLGSMAAALSLPGFLAVFRGRAVLGEDLPLLIFSSAVAAVVIWKHRANIKRILQGTEHRIGERKASHEEG